MITADSISDVPQTKRDCRHGVEPVMIWTNPVTEWAAESSRLGVTEGAPDSLTPECPTGFVRTMLSRVALKWCCWSMCEISAPEFRNQDGAVGGHELGEESHLEI